MKQRLYKIIFEWVTVRILRDWMTHSSTKDYLYDTYYIKDYYNKTNHKTGDDITIVFDDLLWRK
jgi:hypothetical protein